jgi:AhpD family alkylhydroperoxidase
MKTRIQWTEVDPAAYKAMSAVQAYVNNCSLDKKLVYLVEIRASQINGCAFCLDMHCFHAREIGETEQRLYTVAGWREAPFFSDKERAALALTEAVTLVSSTNVPDDVYNEAARHFSDKEMVELLMLIVTINGWNRMVVSTRKLPVERK